LLVLAVLALPYALPKLKDLGRTLEPAPSRSLHRPGPLNA
jgi:hypothetical protein